MRSPYVVLSRDFLSTVARVRSCGYMGPSRVRVRVVRCHHHYEEAETAERDRARLFGGVLLAPPRGGFTSVLTSWLHSLQDLSAVHASGLLRRWHWLPTESAAGCLR
jgi:hypothetical protein